jgi:hypothetical protein
VSFDHPPAARVTSSTTYGALGLDFNVDHLAVTETGASGNLSREAPCPVARARQL